MPDPQWLEWAKRLQAIAQNGLAYAENPFDVERYAAIRSIAVEMVGVAAGVEPSHVTDLFAGESGYATPKLDGLGLSSMTAKFCWCASVLMAAGHCPAAGSISMTHPALPLSKRCWRNRAITHVPSNRV